MSTPESILYIVKSSQILKKNLNYFQRFLAFLKAEFLILFSLNAIHLIAAPDPGCAITMEVKGLHIFVPFFNLLNLLTYPIQSKFKR